MVRSALLPAIASLLIVVGAPAAAQEIFYDGFDRGDLCAWSNPVTPIQEAEAFDESGTNDEPGNEETIGRCAIVEGTIGVPYDSQNGPGEVWEYDTDLYEVAINGPALLEITLERSGGSSDFQPAITLFNESEYPDFMLFPPSVPAEDPITVSRQIFLPEDGFAYLDPDDPDFGSKDIPANNRWFLLVDDARNAGDPACPCGGESNTYRLTLRIVPIVAAATPPRNEEWVQMPGDNSVQMYRVDGATVDTLDLTETVLDKLYPFNTDLDTKLFLVRRVGTNLVTVAGNDDWAVNGSGYFVHTDSKIGSTALTAHPHFVIADWYSRSSPGAIDFQLTIQFQQAFF